MALNALENRPEYAKKSNESQGRQHVLHDNPTAGEAWISPNEKLWDDTPLL